jgi:hypothetical protein
VGFDASVALVGKLTEERFDRVWRLVQSYVCLQHRWSSMGKRAANRPTHSTSGDLNAMDSLLNFDSDERTRPKWVVKSAY